MQATVDFLQTLGTQSLPAFWLPLLAWTLISLPIYGLLRTWKSAHPRLQYDAHRALLLSLPLGFALMQFVHVSLPIVEHVAPASSLPHSPEPIPLPTGATPPSSPPAPSQPVGIDWQFAHVLGVLMLAAFGCAMWRLFTLVRDAWALHRFRRSLPPLDDERAAAILHARITRRGIRQSVELRAAPAGSAPLTFGWRRPIIALPSGMPDDPHTLRMVLEHELVHIQRRDFAMEGLERLIYSLFAIHPGVLHLHRRIDHFRELSCDAEVLDGEETSLPAYARLLLQLQPAEASAPPASVQMIRTDSKLKQRISAMKTLSQRQPSSKSMNVRRRGLLVIVVVLLLPAVFTACTKQPPPPPVETEEVTDEALARQIKRLEVQLDYLMEERETVVDSMETLLGHNDLSSQARFSALRERENLLENMYRERIHDLETLKLERQTRIRLGQNENLDDDSSR